MPKHPYPFTLEAARALMQTDYMCREMNFEIESLGPEGAVCYMTVAPKHVAPNGFLHASLVIFFADTACGITTAANLPKDTLFATMDIKSNHLSTVHEGRLCCKAMPRHLGSRSHVWDAEVTVVETGKCLALFRCTQMTLAVKAD
jgi:uncharacterized protein (TIGR00369 family)